MIRRYLGVWLAFGYLAFIGICAAFVPNGTGSTAPKARRALCANTRLAEQLMLLDPNASPHDNEVAKAFRSNLEGKYLRHPICKDCTISSKDVTEWPELDSATSVPISVDAGPNPMLINSGSIVDVRVDDTKTILDLTDLQVLAVVPDGQKWVLFVARTSQRNLGEIPIQAKILVQAKVLPQWRTCPCECLENGKTRSESAPPCSCSNQAPES